MNTLRLLILALCFTICAGELRSQTLSELLQKADEYSNSIQFAKARETIELAYRQEPSNYEVLWRMARIYIEYSETVPEKDQEKLCLQAREYADRAVQLNPSGMQGYLRRSAALGKLALFKGVFGASSLVKSSFEDAKKALSLNNDGQLPLASTHYVLGRIHLKLSEKPKLFRMPLGLGFGNIDDAIVHLKKAAELRPGFIMFHLDYARALVAEDRLEEARGELRKIPSMKTQAYNDDNRREEARKLLKEIEGK